MAVKNCIGIAAMLMAVLLGAAGLATVGTAETAGELRIDSQIGDGGFIIRVAVADGDAGWAADEMAQDDSVVRLQDAGLVDGAFVARYAPVGDGDVTVAVRHFTGIACDQLMTWDLCVADGAVQEVIGGSHAKAPTDYELDPALLGDWLEADAQFTRMTVSKRPGGGWDVEIISPVSHAAFVFRASALFDCELDSFVYDDGAYWDIPADGEGGTGAAQTAGTCGRLAVSGDAAAPTLEWYDAARPEETVRFERVEPDL